MKILITNDDGIHAEGLRVLADTLKDEHEVYIAAPASQCSAFSHSVTYFRKRNKAQKAMIEGVKEAWAIEGTPADCVFYAVCGLFDVTFDAVISGINDGRNMATDIIYSGTVGAAGEGMLCGIPSIAVSLCGKSRTHYETAAEAVKTILPHFIEDSGNRSYILNINVPDLPKEEIKGFKAAVMDLPEDYKRPITIERLNDDTCTLSMDLNLEHKKREISVPDGDVSAVRDGYIAVTPLMYDMVRYGVMNRLKKIEEIPF